MFNSQGFATFEPGAASAQARSVVTNFVPGVGIQGGGFHLPLMGLIAVLGGLFLLHRMRYV